jgi:NAD(P)H-dependent FMN reductase
MNVLVLIGSLRDGSTNRQLADVAIRHLPDGTDVTIWEELADLPHYSEDLEGADLPAIAAAFRRRVGEADALIVVTPEYNGLMSSAVKNAIDWASRPRGEASIVGLPAAVLAASGSARAAQWARESAVRALTVAGAAPLETTIGIGLAHKAFAEGDLVDPDQRQAVADLIGTLVATKREASAA